MRVRSEAGYLGLFEMLLRARALEETIQANAPFYHSGFGMEAVGTGVGAALRRDDALVAHYRGVAAPLAKGMSMLDLLRSFLLRQTSPVRGRTWHPVAPDVGIYGHQGTSGSEFGRAAGLAVAAKHRGNDAIAVGMFGDGSAQRGTLHEGFLTAVAWELPVLWVCENNGFMISTRADAIFPGDVAELAAGYHMVGEVVDGNDVVAVDEAARRLVDDVRRTSRPALLEAKTYRVRPHTEIEGAPYQDDAEISRWRARDPVVVARDRLLADGVTADALDALEAGVRVGVEEALEQVLGEPGHDPAEDATAWLYATGSAGEPRQ